jgi:hypothetical protein
MDYEKAFQDLYDHYELAISNGVIHGDDFDRVDSILSVVWQLKEPDTISRMQCRKLMGPQRNLMRSLQI